MQLSSISEPLMADARPVFCGQCEANVRPERQWTVATIEPPHFGGPEAARLSNRRRPTRDDQGNPDLSGFSVVERLLVDGQLSQFEISIRQYVQNGATVKEDEELEFYALQFPLTDSDEVAKQHKKQMQYLFTDRSEVRLAYYLLKADAKKMVVLNCPYCGFFKRLSLKFIEKQYNKVLDVGGRLVLSSSGLEIRGGGATVRRPKHVSQNE